MKSVTIGRCTLHHGDCREVLATLPEACVDSVVTDPPYELGFMGRTWDASGIAYDASMWRQVCRVLKPGGHLLAFGATRTYHRMACAIEDAGFEIRDCIQWLYGSGFPKSHDVSKAIDKALGATRKTVGRRFDSVGNTAKSLHKSEGFAKGRETEYAVTVPATADAKQWQGYGTALKPANEPIVVARKPLSGTVAANVMAHGTGGINIDGCRVPYANDKDKAAAAAAAQRSCRDQNANRHTYSEFNDGLASLGAYFLKMDSGRWPANVIHDGSLTGPASRFFYCAKASRSERGEGNRHPTVKPLALARYLTRLVTPTEGIVLTPFLGSGTELVGAVMEGFGGIGIEQDRESFATARRRIIAATKQNAR